VPGLERSVALLMGVEDGEHVGGGGRRPAGRRSLPLPGVSNQGAFCKIPGSIRKYLDRDY
jgi:hypothetical protein